MRVKIIIPLLILIFTAAGIQAGMLGDFMKGLASPTGTTPDAQTTASGLKEALTVGAGNAVGLLSQQNGYFENQMVKILMPKQVQKVADVLGKIGYQPQVDEFVLSMNRAAEAAAPKAKVIFIDAIKQMSFDDAIKILKGDQTAATQYLKSKTYDTLAETFKPTISSTMNNYGVTRQYDQLIGTYTRAFPVLGLESMDLDRYVTGKALDGVFYMIGEEEKQIRTNPAARVTELLKTVFGK